MTELRATTQAELDAILARDDLNYLDFEIVIDSPAGVWITVSDGRGLDVRAYGSASVRASDRASVRASGSASVRASDRASVRASGSASVRASDRASVRAYDRASVRAYGSASVEAYDRASVRASGSASVEASGSASVEAYGSASVRAYGSASVEAYDRASVRAGKYVAVHLHSQRVTLQGGVLIDMTQVDETDPRQWCDLHGVSVDEDGTAHLYKAVDQQWMAGHGYTPTSYEPGTDPECDMWRDNNDCGGGLHACPTPWMALDHYRQATRFVEVTCPVDTLRPIDSSKCKASTVHVLREVTRDMKPVEVSGDE